jgi:hypothetical protein
MSVFPRLCICLSGEGTNVDRFDKCWQQMYTLLPLVYCMTFVLPSVVLPTCVSVECNPVIDEDFIMAKMNGIIS